MVIKMKITLDQISGGSEEVIIRYKQMTERIEGLVRYLERQEEKISVYKEGHQHLISISDIIYLESVEGVTFLYTENEVYKINMTLMSFETLYAKEGFFRCSKAMIINIYRIRKLKSMPGSRIDAAMDNEEHIIISRRYAKALRDILKEGIRCLD